MLLVLIIQCFIKQYNNTFLGVLLLKTIIVQHSVLKFNSRLSFY